MKLISFSFLHWQYPLLLSILSFFQICFAYAILMANKNELNGMFICLLNAFCSLVFIIFEFIACFINRKKTRPSINKIMLNPPTLLVKPKRTINFKLIFLYALISVISIVPNTLYSFYLYNQLTYFSCSQAFIGIIFTCIFSCFFFKKRLFKHHILSLAIILIIIIGYFLVLHSEAEKMIQNSYGHFWEFLGLTTLYVASESLREVSEKNMMEIHFVSHFLLLFSEGIISSIIIISFSIGLDNFECDKTQNQFSSFLCRNLKWKEFVVLFRNLFTQHIMHILLGVGYIIVSILNNLVRIFTNKKLSSSHRYISEIVFSLYYIVFVRIIKIFAYTFESDVWLSLSKKHLYTEIVQFCLIIFVFFIYNEYIIIHFWKLDIFSKKEIINRERDETASIVSFLNKDTKFIDINSSFD